VLAHPIILSIDIFQKFASIPFFFPLGCSIWQFWIVHVGVCRRSPTQGHRRIESIHLYRITRTVRIGFALKGRQPHKRRQHINDVRGPFPFVPSVVAMLLNACDELLVDDFDFLLVAESLAALFVPQPLDFDCFSHSPFHRPAPAPRLSGSRFSSAEIQPQRVTTASV
jgi:hypothetical protein